MRMDTSFLTNNFCFPVHQKDKSLKIIIIIKGQGCCFLMITAARTGFMQLLVVLNSCVATSKTLKTSQSSTMENEHQTTTPLPQMIQLLPPSMPKSILTSFTQPLLPPPHVATAQHHLSTVQEMVLQEILLEISKESCFRFHLSNVSHNINFKRVMI